MLSSDILGSFKGKHVLVTGGTGLIGRQVVDILLSTDANVYTASLDGIALDERVYHEFADLTDFATCRGLTTEMDYVFHLAGIKGSIEVTKSKPASFFVPLLQMNTNILEACRINKVQKVVYTSSIGAYPPMEIFKETDIELGPPMDMYPGWAKRIAEMQIQAYKIQYGLTNFAIVRPCNVYGPGDNFDPDNAMVIPSLIYKIYRGDDPVVIWGDGTAVRDFAYSRDIAEGIILALYYGTESTYYNLGSGIGYSIRELVETLCSFLSFNYIFDTIKASGYSKRVMDISLAREKLGYNPTVSLKEGLQLTCNWFCEHSTEFKEKFNYFREGRKYYDFSDSRQGWYVKPQQ